MSNLNSFAHAPWGVFPTDVTSPLPPQVPGSQTDSQRAQTGAPASEETPPAPPRPKDE